MKNSKKYKWLYIILGIIIVVLVVVMSWMLGKDSGSKSKATQSVEIVKQKVAQKSSVASSTVKEAASPQPTASSSSTSDPNIAFGKEIDSDEFLVLAYCKKWNYGLNDFLSNASENNNAELVHDSDCGDFHGTSINQGTGDSLCELNGTTDTTITISGGNPTAQSDFHNITYNKQDLIHQFLNSQDDVQTLQTLTNTLISNHQANQANADNDNDD